MHPRAIQAEQLKKQVLLDPTDAVAWHNLAATQGDLGYAAGAEQSARCAISLGIGAPETRLVLARALQSLGRLDEAEAAFREAVRIRPGYAEAHRDWAQLIWMRTGNVDAALQSVSEQMKVNPTAGLHLIHSIVLQYSGDEAAAQASAEAGLVRDPDNLGLLRQASNLATRVGDSKRALTLAQRARALAPDDTNAAFTHCEALLADGRAAEAAELAEVIQLRAPDDQYAMALVATCWRLLDDARYQVVFNYAEFVSIHDLLAPSEAAERTAFFSAVAETLERLHPFRTHPLEQSVRGGSQLPIQARELADPRIAALFERIRNIVKQRVLDLGHSHDWLRRRNTGCAAVSGAWSVRLTSDGSHVDHVHPRGWISSACYVALPSSVGSGEPGPGAHAGWIRFGRPGIVTRPALDAEHCVRPELGRLVLFPSYMWHGVAPFVNDQPRLSVAFDLVPVSACSVSA